jgi:predicted phage terminase large subunit-like protein
MHVLDIWRKQASSSDWVESFCDLVRRWKPLEWAEEKGQIKAGVGPFLDRRQLERKAWTSRKGFPTKHDKAVRAQSIRGRMELSGLYFPFNASWAEALRSELLGFPAGKHDDMCDALGLIGQLLDTIQIGHAPKVVTEIKDTGYRVRKLDNKIDDWIIY